MNKKLLLFVLPALMAMSSCTYLASGTVQNANFFKEEASAKADIFGGEEQAVTLRKNLPFRSAEADMAEPVIGVQYRAAYEKDSKSYIAVRFVVAIKSLDVNAEWTRSVYEADGSRHGSEASYETTQAYTALSGMGETIYPSSYGAGYNYFVAYTLYDIPATGKENLYIVANLKLTDTKEEDKLSPVYSKAMAARIGGDVTVKFDKDRQDGYFLSGKIGGTADQEVNQDYPTRNDNKATFTADFSNQDEFLIVQKDYANSKFRVFDSGCLADGNGNFDNTGENGRIKTSGAGGKIRLYLNNSYRLYAGAAFVPTGTTYFVRGDVNGWDCADGYELLTDGGDCQGVIYNVSLPAGNFKIANSNWNSQWGFADGSKNKRITGPVAGRFSGDYDIQDSNIYCDTADIYNIMLKNDHTIFIWEA